MRRRDFVQTGVEGSGADRLRTHLRVGWHRGTGSGQSKRQAAFTIPGGQLEGLNGFDGEEYWEIPGRVVNDSPAALLGEVWRGATLGGQNVIMITRGTGVGGGMP